MTIPLRLELRMLLLDWPFLAGGVVALLAGLACAGAGMEPGNERFATLLSLGGIALMAGAAALMGAWKERDERRTRIALDRLFGTEELESLGSTWERWPRPPRTPRPKLLDQPKGTEFWMKKLAERYARLARLEELRAPQTIIEAEQRMIQKAIAQLSPADALAVMRVWPELASKHVKKGRPPSPPGESN